MDIWNIVNAEVAKNKGRRLARQEFDMLPDPLSPYWDIEYLATKQAEGFETQFIIAYKEERKVLEKVYKRGLADGKTNTTDK